MHVTKPSLSRLSLAFAVQVRRWRSLTATCLKARVFQSRKELNSRAACAGSHNGQQFSPHLTASVPCQPIPRALSSNQPNSAIDPNFLRLRPYHEPLHHHTQPIFPLLSASSPRRGGGWVVWSQQSAAFCCMVAIHHDICGILLHGCFCAPFPREDVASPPLLAGEGARGTGPPLDTPHSPRLC